MKLNLKSFMLACLTISIFGCSLKQKKKDNPLEAIPPQLTRPEVRKIWVPDQIHDNIYEMGHWQYVIDKQSVWSKKD